MPAHRRGEAAAAGSNAVGPMSADLQTTPADILKEIAIISRTR